MRTRWLAIALALGLVAAPSVAPPAAQAAGPCQDEDGNLVFDELVQWIKAPDARVGNLGGVSEMTGEDVGDYPTWSDEEPSGSIADGAGGATLQHRRGQEGDDRAALGHFEGTFTGCIDTVAVDLFMGGSPSGSSGASPLADVQVANLELVIDGQAVVPWAGRTNIAVTSEGPGLYRMRFAFTDVYQAMSSAPQDFAPLEETHDIEITLHSWWVSDVHPYLYDATETPSHVTFNKAALFGYTLVSSLD